MTPAERRCVLFLSALTIVALACAANPMLIPPFMMLAAGGAAVWASCTWLWNQDRKQWLHDVTYKRSSKW